MLKGQSSLGHSPLCLGQLGIQLGLIHRLIHQHLLELVGAAGLVALHLDKSGLHRSVQGHTLTGSGVAGDHLGLGPVLAVQRGHDLDVTAHAVGTPVELHLGDGAHLAQVNGQGAVPVVALPVGVNLRRIVIVAGKGLAVHCLHGDAGALHAVVLAIGVAALVGIAADIGVLGHVHHTVIGAGHLLGGEGLVVHLQVGHLAMEVLADLLQRQQHRGVHGGHRIGPHAVLVLLLGKEGHQLSVDIQTGSLEGAHDGDVHGSAVGGHLIIEVTGKVVYVGTQAAVRSARHLDAPVIAGEERGLGGVGLTVLGGELQVKGDGVGVGQGLQRGLQEGGAVEGEPAVCHRAAGEGGIIAVAAGVVNLAAVGRDVVEVVVQHQGADTVHVHSDLGAGAFGQTGGTQLVLGEGVVLLGAAPGLFAEDGHGAQHTLVDIQFRHTLLALVTPHHALGAQQVGLTHQGVVAAEHGGIPVVEQVFGVGHVSVGTTGVGIQEGVPAVDDLVALCHTLRGVLIAGAPDVQLVVLRQLLGGLAQSGLSGDKAAGAGAPHTDLGVRTQVILNGLTQRVGKLGKGVVGGLVVHPVLIGADVHHISVHHRVSSLRVFVPQRGGELEGTVLVLTSQVQQFQIPLGAGTAVEHGPAFQPVDVVRVLLGVLVVEQGVAGHIQLGEHIHSHVLTHLGQFSPLLLGVGGITLIIFIVVVVVGIDEVLRDACVLGLRGQAGELLALQAVEAGVCVHCGVVDVAVVVVVDVEVELVHLVPQHDLGIVLELLVTIGSPGHVQHQATHLIGGVVAHDALGDGHVVLRLPQDLLGGDGSVQAAGVGGGIDMQALVIGDHYIALIPHIVAVFIAGQGFDVNVVGAGGSGAGLHRQGDAGNLFHIRHQVVGHLGQAHIGLVVEDDLGVRSEGKAALIAVPLLDGGNDLGLGVGVRHSGEPLVGIVVLVVGHRDGDIFLGIAGLVALVGEAQQQGDVPLADVPLADGAVVGHHVLQLTAPHHQVTAGDGR